MSSGNSPDFFLMNMAKERLTLFFLFAQLAFPFVTELIVAVVDYEDVDSFAATTRNSRFP